MNSKKTAKQNRRIKNVKLQISNPGHELIWPGKNSETVCQVLDDSNRSLWRVTERFFPAQNFSSSVSLSPEFNIDETSVSPWLNKLFWGENFLVLQTLADRFAGKIDLIYIDPPFATGSSFSFQRPIGEKTYRDKHHQIVDVAYRDCWDSGLPSYLSMMLERLRLMYNLLSEKGSLYVHVDYRVSAYLRLILDEIFGPENFVNEIIWFYKTGGMPEKLGFGRKHDNILFYVKNKNKATWNPQKEKSYLTHNYGFSNIKIYEDERGKYSLVNCRDVFDIPALRGNQPEKVDYPTQKPEALLERIINASTNPGDLVADFFCGSGTTLCVAEKLGRRWLGSDLGPWAVHVTKKRLLQIRGCAPFEVLQLAGETQKKKKYSYGKPVIDLRVVQKNDKSIELELKNFFYPHPELIPEEIKTKIEKWSDYIDYWAVSLDDKQDVFLPWWVGFRTRNERRLPLNTSPCTFNDVHGGRVRVKVVDIFGQETEFFFVCPLCSPC
jgi:adenine specific DNA methylase Mod